MPVYVVGGTLPSPQLPSGCAEGLPCKALTPVESCNKAPTSAMYLCWNWLHITGIWGPSSQGFLRAHTGKQYRRCGVLRKRAWDV